MAKTMTAGGEVDAYCTKCRMDLNHRIVAMGIDRIARVECLTCRTQHNFYKPKSAAAPTKPRKKRDSDAPASKSAPRISNIRKHWDQAIAGRSVSEFTPYTIAATFVVGQLVQHKKFGSGVVSEVVDAAKVLVIFEDGGKLLAQGQQGK